MTTATRPSTAPPPTWRVSWVALALAALGVLVSAVASFALAGRLTGQAYADVDALRDAVGEGVQQWVASGTAQLPPALEAPVRFWSAFHVVKAVGLAVLAAALIVLLVTLPRGARPARWLRLAQWGLALGLTGVVLIVIANVQGAISPLSSALSLVPDDPHLATPAPLAELAQVVETSHPAAVRATLVADFARYHAVVAVLIALVALTALVLAVAVVVRARRARATDGRRRIAAPLALLVLAALAATLAVANLGTALDPVPALQGFLDGGGHTAAPREPSEHPLALADPPPSPPAHPCQ